MGGLKSKLPVTYGTMLAATLAIAGIPPLAGFFSKDEILWKAWDAGHPMLWAIGFVTAGLTAFYMFRLFYLAFHGRFRGEAEVLDHAHESPPSMAVPLIVLAALSVVGGWIGLPHAIGGPLGGLPNVFEGWLEPVFADAGHAVEAAHAVPPIEIGLMVASVAVAVLGILLAWWMYVRHLSAPEALAARLRGLYTLLRGKYFIDELYEVLVVRPFNALSQFAWRIVDDLLIDGLFVNGSGALVRLGSRVASGWETGYVQSYLLVFFGGVVLLLVFLVFGG